MTATAFAVLLVDKFWSLTATGLTQGAIYALVALGYTLVYGVLRLINFAHSEVFMLGTMAALFAVKGVDRVVGGSPAQWSVVHVVLALLAGLAAAMVVSGATALGLERLAYRPLRGAGDRLSAALLGLVAGLFLARVITSGLSGVRSPTDAPEPFAGIAFYRWWWLVLLGAVLAVPFALAFWKLFQRRKVAPRLAALISAIGASLAIAEAVAAWRGRDVERIPQVLSTTELFSFFDAQINPTQLVVIVAAVVMMVGLDQFVNRTRLGRGVRAVAQDAETATLMGVNIDRVIMLTFLLGGVMAGGAALLFMVKDGVTRYNIGFLLGVKAFTAAVLGGIGNLRGALLGGLLLGLIENYGSAVFGTQWKDPIAFTVLVVVLLFRPTGLLGESLGKARV